MTVFWPLSRQQVPDANGLRALDARVRFYASDTTTPITVFADAGRTVPHEQPIACDGAGRFPRVFLPDGLYGEEVFRVSTGLLWRDDGLGVPVVDAGEGPIEPTLPPESAFFATGDVKWRLDGGIQPDWVRMNGRTIGNAGSGASERADADTRDLYRYLWLNFGDDLAPVLGGRGLSWDEDFTAGKPISVPSMQGCLQAGLDTMGSSSADRLQTTVALTLTQGSGQATASTANGLAIGMAIFADGIAVGTTITDVAGTTIGLSAPASASGTVTARCGALDASRPGAIGGEKVRGLGNRNLPPQLPNGSATYDVPPLTNPRYAELVDLTIGSDGTKFSYPGVWRAVTGNTIDPPPETIPVTIANPGGGVAFSLVQACRVGTFYLKL